MSIKRPNIFTFILIMMLFSVMWLSASTYAQDITIPGTFITDSPTLICLGFEWYITGDENHNAEVTVKYHKVGEKQWKDALPLLRIMNEKVDLFDKYPQGNIISYTAPNMFAGSIFDLDPDTEYECNFTLADPDGVDGDRIKTITARTRKEPKPFAGGRIFHVYPPDYTGLKIEPSFTHGIMEAYYGPGGGDWSVIPGPKVEPGDIILMHAGEYKSDWFSYNSDPMLLVETRGTYILTKSGTPEKPIAIMSAGDGEVVIDGNGCSRLFDVMTADNLYFEGLTFRNADTVFFAGYKNQGGCKGLVVKNCRFEDVGICVVTQYAGSENFYIADNVMLGRDDRDRLQGWNMMWLKLGSPSRVKSYYAVKVYGRGHVVCHNDIRYFHDGICISTYGNPEKDRNLECSAIDFYNNDIFLMTDDFIEADGGVHNIRVLRNRCMNAAMNGLSAQPIFGGPAYYIRNILYNVPSEGALKFTACPAGLIVYQNTFCADWFHYWCMFSNAHFRNNLVMGNGYPGKTVFRMGTYTSYTSYDYNGYRPNPQLHDVQFTWKVPQRGIMQDYTVDSAPEQNFATLNDFRNKTGQEQHGILVDYDIFENVTLPDAQHPHKVYQYKTVDFRLKQGAKAVDAGCVLPNVNDGFTGKAPDLGALEMNVPEPQYGPRDR